MKGVVLYINHHGWKEQELVEMEMISACMKVELCNIFEEGYDFCQIKKIEFFQK